jgi:hypothetical protein
MTYLEEQTRKKNFPRPVYLLETVHFRFRQFYENPDQTHGEAGLAVGSRNGGRILNN